MSDAERHVLVVGAGRDGIDRVAPMLRRAEFNVHTMEATPFLLDLVLGTAFELLIVAFPLSDLSIDDLLIAVRDENSGCREAGFLLMAEPDYIDDARALMDLGVNRVISADWVDARLWQAVGDLLSVAPRVHIRVLLQAALDMAKDRNGALYRTVNVSHSGVLLQGSEQMVLGGSFEFLFRLPGGGLIEGSAEVVRRTNPMREGIEGIGARFVSFRGQGEDRLREFVSRQLTFGNKK